MTININLLPKSKRKLRQAPVILAIGLGVLLAGSYYLYFDYRSAQEKHEALQSQLQAILQQKTALQKNLAQARQKDSNQPDLTRYLDLPKMIQAASVDADFLFDRLAEVLPKGSVLNSMEFKEPDQLKINGSFSTIEEAVSFIQAVEQSAYFSMQKIGSVGKNVDQKSLVQEMTGGETVAPLYTLSFEMVIKRNQPVAEHEANAAGQSPPGTQNEPSPDVLQASEHGNSSASAGATQSGSNQATVAAVQDDAAKSPDDTQPKPQAKSETNVVKHLTKPGDTLFKLSRQYYGNNFAVNRIANYNGLNRSEPLKPGKVLLIPDPVKQ